MEISITFSGTRDSAHFPYLEELAFIYFKTTTKSIKGVCEAFGNGWHIENMLSSNVQLPFWSGSNKENKNEIYNLDDV